MLSVVACCSAGDLGLGHGLSWGGHGLSLGGHGLSLGGHGLSLGGHGLTLGEIAVGHDDDDIGLGEFG